MRTFVRSVVRRSVLVVSLLVVSASIARAQLWDAGDLFLASPDPGDSSWTDYGLGLAACDWNGDGRDDLVIGAPTFGVGGAVFFLYLDAAGVVRSGGVRLGLEDEDLGDAIACGDFDGDGVDDVALGAPSFELDELAEGRVILMRFNGTAMAYVRELRQSLPDVAGAPEDNDRFGQRLAAGDWNADGADDLAVGSPGEAVGSAEDAGAVTFFYGAAGTGIGIAGNAIWHKDVAGVTGVAADDEDAGDALAAFDANCDAYADLAIGIPDQDVDGVEDAGAVYILYGGAGGLVAATNQTLDTTSFSQVGAQTPFPGDAFGAALAPAGNFFGSSCGALAIGAPYRQVGGDDNAGAIYLLRHNAGVSRYYTESSFGGDPDPDQRFGRSFAFADFERDGRDDLAVGVSGGSWMTTNLTGGVYVALSRDPEDGGTGEPDPATASLIVPRDTLGLVDFILQDGDMGSTLAAGDLDGDGYADLAIGLPTGDYVDENDQGGVQVLFGALFAADFEGGDLAEW